MVNTPFGSTPNGSPGSTVTRSGPLPLRYVPCITTIQGLAAGVQGIEALIRGELRVTTLQEHHAALAAATKPAVSA